jgi:Fur family transcriptional regulator, zinc uptake regulator
LCTDLRAAASLTCQHNHAANDNVVFMICERCGAVGEAASRPVKEALNAAAADVGFAPRMQVIEVTGQRAHCLSSDLALR